MLNEIMGKKLQQNIKIMGKKMSKIKITIISQKKF